jgi:hypothetical protein
VRPFSDKQVDLVKNLSRSQTLTKSASQQPFSAAC